MKQLTQKKDVNLHALVVTIISVCFLAFHVYIVIRGTLPYIVAVPVHFSFGLALTFLYNPIDKKNEKLKPLKFIDWLLIAGTAVILIYYVSQGERLENRMPFLSPVTTMDYVVCFLSMALLLEATRRTLGSFFLGFVIVCIVYMFLGKYLPRGSGLRHAGTTVKKFVEVMSMSTSGILGTPLTTSSSYLFYFMIFGALFASCGGGQLLIEIGLRFGKGVGGPAKAAVISSGLMGMISGAAVANVSTTGCMTIPMMKKTGYTPEQAGAVEAVASTGGQIMPPVMGIAAFVMAEMLGMDYKTICGAAAIPAIAYYLSILLVVHFIACQTRQGRMSKGFDIDPILPRLFLLLPAFILVYMIIAGYSLMRAATIASVSIIVLNFVNPRRIPMKKVFEALIKGCKSGAAISIPTAASGIVIACVINSGLANKLASLMLSVGGENLLLALIIAMLGCILFGMALPTVAAYLLASILFCPVLIELGVSRLAANMFVFYFGIFAQVTPPVCLASFTAAGISGGDTWKTGWLALRWSLVAFLAAFAFVYNPALLLEGTVPEIIQAGTCLFLGTYFLAAGSEHYVGVPVKSKFLQVLLCLAGVAIIIPEEISTFVGYVVGVSIILMLNLREKHEDLPEDARAYYKKNNTLITIAGVGGVLIAFPEFITTAIGLVIAALTLAASKLVKKPASILGVEDDSEDEQYLGEVIIQDIDREEDDLIFD